MKNTLEQRRRLEAREPKMVYFAVCKLRKEGFRVFRHGPDRHLINGKVVSTKELKALAKSIPEQLELFLGIEKRAA